MPSANLETLVTLLGKEKPTPLRRLTARRRARREVEVDDPLVVERPTLSMWRILSAYAFSSFLALRITLLAPRLLNRRLLRVDFCPLRLSQRAPPTVPPPPWPSPHATPP